MASIKNKSKLAATQSKQAKNNASPKATLQLFMQENIDRMHRLGKVRTGETYTCTLNSFMRFRQGKDVLWKDFDADLTASYEAYLKSTGVSMNTISFYNRILRAVYNRAVEKGFTKQVFPFKNVYTGVEKTIYNPQIQFSPKSETKRPKIELPHKTKRSENHKRTTPKMQPEKGCIFSIYK